MVAAGCFTTGCIVLAEGKVVEGIFRVDHLGHPIPEAKVKKHICAHTPTHDS